MSRVALPEGWRAWPLKAQEELLAGLEALAQERETGRGPWLCDIPDCDGRPHKGRMNEHSRAEQRPPADPDWDSWLLLAGRGFGKTRTGAEWVLKEARRAPVRIALIGATAADVRDIMVEGESGIMACARSSFRPEYQPSKRRVVFPNGSMAFCYSADEPERLRGPQHHLGWCDELAAWRYLQMAWDMYQMGLRLGEHPRTCITTTPRPLPLVKALVKDTERVRTVRGSTYANLHNLAPVFQRAVLDRYAGTTLGRQELDAEILDDMPGALVRRKDIGRVAEAPEMTQVVVGVDPAGTGTGDEAGIVVAGHGADGRFYILADLSGRMSARETGLTAWKALYEYGAAHLVYEDNFGKQWLRDGLIDAYADHHRLDAQQRAVVRDESTADRAVVPNPFLMLRKVTAQHGKVLRAQPVAMRYEQGKVSHVGDHEKFEQLEGQLCTWDPHEDKDSPDRIDALVHAVTHLMRRERSVASVGALPHQFGIGRAAGASVHPLHRMIGRAG